MKKFVVLSMVLGIVGYAGAAIPTTGLQLHLDASSLTGYSNGQTVSTWTDLAGGDNTGTSAGTPTYIANALNGHAAISITGSLSLDGYSWTGQDTDFYSFNAVPVVKTVAMVFKRTSNTYYGGIPLFGNSAATGWVGVDGAFGANNWGTGYASTSADPSIQWAELAINGTYIGNGQATAYTGVPTEYHIATIRVQDWGSSLNISDLAGSPRLNGGAGRAWGMDVAEVLLYDTMLSNSDLTSLTNSLGAKYNLVPEPMTMSLLGLGGLLALRRRKA